MSLARNVPTFLVVGAAGSGTPVTYSFEGCGEENRFSGAGDEEVCGLAVASLEAYEERLEAVPDEAAMGRTSPWYHSQTWRRANGENEAWGV